jgi:hypothetical protein
MKSEKHTLSFRNSAEYLPKPSLLHGNSEKRKLLSKRRGKHRIRIIRK